MAKETETAAPHAVTAPKSDIPPGLGGTLTDHLIRFRDLREKSGDAAALRSLAADLLESKEVFGVLNEVEQKTLRNAVVRLRA